MLGIIGGMGPHAGKHLFECILKHSKATKDQDHLPLILWSTPNRIADRSEFLLGKTTINPAYAVADIIQKQYQIGVRIIGIPCNTFHAQPIWATMLKKLAVNNQNNLKIIHMIKVAVDVVVQSYPLKKVGILGTLGTYENQVYAKTLTEKEIAFIEPDHFYQKKVHQSIYDSNFGIKATGKTTNISLELIHQTIQHLINNGADTILLGCTELSLIPVEKLPKEAIFVDPLEVLAKTMIETYHNNQSFL